MRVSGKAKTMFLLALLLLCTSCGTSSCDWGNAPRTEYYIQGADVEFRPTTAVDQPVSDFVHNLFDERRLYMGLWRVDADDSDESYKIRPGYVSADSQFSYYNGHLLEPSAESFSGRTVVDGHTLGLDLDITTPDTEFTDLAAWGTCNYDDAQRLIKQVRLPAWSNNTSTDTAEVTWELVGNHNGEHFSVSFTQVFCGKSRYPMYPYL